MQPTPFSAIHSRRAALNEMMQIVFSSSSIAPCDLVVSALDAEGIPAVIKNELGSAVCGYSIPLFDNPSLPWAWPEVWVNEEDYDKALAIAEGFRPNPSNNVEE